MKKIAIILFFIHFCIYSQETISYENIYKENNLVYNSLTKKLFSGIAQGFKKSNHLSFEMEFEKGILKTTTQYYKGKEKRIAEIKFYLEDGKIYKKLKYSFDRTYTWTVHYDLNETKILEEEHENEVLKYYCEFLNGKKNGKEVCVKENGLIIENFYENGKLK
ncbi:hypothetical protein [Flavobacterium helocola]|jgi:antitoxin component YwqK of YwqJK toxin-antitoxin module|uniref:MORN repeat variant n=1 Tax=Flavobacterium helocola TaxID=3139139 RepID=A0ABU9I4V4_9FLAO